MQGVTTAIVAFILVCLIYPHLVKHRPQFWSALGLVLLILLFDAIGHMATDEKGGLVRVMYVLTALMQMMALVLLVLCAGGLSVSDLAGEVANTVEVIRRREDKPVLVPLRGEQPRPRGDESRVPEQAAPPAPPAPAAPVPPRPERHGGDDAPIPLE